ncbi:hypothetical protein BB561_002428 [Smittium simulii]|uniref:Pre-mRNA-splicing factor CEF1 n=1 Tax=Smittium simulii TaxID=133385 RepID=A0A2T9YQJ1_9FUNG|nr:hypothetical protein BB561_002428 [Smittium simulii]
MRINIKGGVWKNTEDEILKAAVMKYGKNQWARISSLLVRKTPKQCKARWYEWIDPSIKKTEWSKDEDEKLLHLAKLMPTQWRTIAPIVGRTPAQCLERYQKLLDDAEALFSGKKDELALQGPQGGEFGDLASDDVRRLRLGEIDPDPETKPARPDPVDMDEDEKEMLSEARARLANTQGKKAKRKAREKQLEEAKKLASLQKRRELKAAGIEIKKFKKRKHMDYNADIPFEKMPAPGFYDTTDELVSKGIAPASSKIKLQDIEPKKRWEREEDAAKRKQNNKKQADEKDTVVSFVKSKLDAAVLQKEQADRLLSRPKLVLPAPQVSDNELKTIAKIAQKGDQAQEFVDSLNPASSVLLNDYSSHFKQNMAARTPQISESSNSIMAEAINLIGLTTQQTPLLGEENTPFHASSGTGFQGITPLSNAVQTPNPLLTPFRHKNSTSNNDSSASLSTRTPLRDFLGLNTPYADIDSVSSTPMNIEPTKITKKKLAEKLLSLPAPKNQFEIVLPELENDLEDPSSKTNDRVETVVEDREVIEKRELQILADKEKERLEMRSTSVKKDLPRPLSFDLSKLSINSEGLDSEIKNAIELVNNEMVLLISYDAENYPYYSRNSTLNLKNIGHNINTSQLESISQNNLLQAREMIMSECDSIKDQLINNDSLYIPSLLSDNSINKELWVPSIQATIEPSNTKNTENVIEAYRSILEKRHSLMSKEATRATKMEKKQSILLGGSKPLIKGINETFKELEEARIELNSFKFLQSMEKTAIQTRTFDLQTHVNQLDIEESQLQQKYKSLTENL